MPCEDEERGRLRSAEVVVIVRLRLEHKINVVAKTFTTSSRSAGQHDKTQQNTTQHDKTRHNTTRHNNTLNDTTVHNITEQNTKLQLTTHQKTTPRSLQCNYRQGTKIMNFIIFASLSNLHNDKYKVYSIETVRQRVVLLIRLPGSSGGTTHLLADQ